MIEDTAEELAAHKRIEDAIYTLTRAQRQHVDASAVRNIITDLWPAIVTEMRGAQSAKREECAKVVDRMGDVYEAPEIAKTIRAL